MQDNPSSIDPLDKSLRLRTDPVADEVVKHILQDGDEEAAKKLFDVLIHNSDEVPSDFHPILVNYFKDTATLPDFADPDMMKKGAEVFSKYGPGVMFLLTFLSLPLTYTAKKGVTVLFKTGRLNEDRGHFDVMTRRLVETSQFVIDVMNTGGLEKEGKGIRAVQKVRLMHASIRHFLRQHGWNVDEFDEPINQEDLLGTLMSFSALILDGFPKIGLKASDEEKEAFFHCWRIVGHLMGIEAELIPQTFQEGLEIGYKVLDSQAQESEAGKAMTKACLDYLEHILPGNLFDNVPHITMRYLVGDKKADLLGIPPSSKLTEKVIARVTHIMGRTIDTTDKDYKFIGKILAPFNRKLLEALVNHFNQSKAIKFFIPPNLKSDWEMEEVWTDIFKVNLYYGRRINIQKKGV